MYKDIFKNSKWIFADTSQTEICDSYFDYIANFTVQPETKVYLYISAHSQYAAYINGQFVDCGQMDDYETCQFYDTLDITPFVKEGKNKLLICQYVCGTDCATRRVAHPGIIFTIRSEEKEYLVSSEECLSRRNRKYLENREFITRQIGYNFEYDATVVEDKFSVSVLANKEKYLMPRPIKKLTIQPTMYGKILAQGIFMENDTTLPKSKRMQTAYLSSREVLSVKDYVSCWNLSDKTRADGVYVVTDLGGESAGLLTFSLDVPEKTEVLIGIGEHLDDLRVRSACGERNFCFRYIAHAGHNEFFHPFQRLGMRFVQLHIYSREGKLYGAGIKPTTYPLTDQPTPVTDGLHKRIYDACKKTLRLCMHEHYEDCPWREQALYTMDSRNQILSGYYAFGETEFPRASLALMLPSLREDGLLDLCPPGRVDVNIPSYTAVYVREVMEYVQFSGDISLAEELFDGLKTIVDKFVSRIDETGMVPLFYGPKYWNFYEWQPGLSGIIGDRFEEGLPEKVYESPLNAFVSDAFYCLSEICAKIRPEYVDDYRLLHEKLNCTLHEQFYDEKTGGYLTRLGDDTPRHALTQALMLYVNAVPKKKRVQIEKLIMEEELIPCTLSMSVYEYESLLMNPDNIGYVICKIENIWGKMLDAGADTFWETEVGADDFDKAGSLCHGWSAVPAYIFSILNKGDGE